MVYAIAAKVGGSAQFRWREEVVNAFIMSSQPVQEAFVLNALLAMEANDDLSMQLLCIGLRGHYYFVSDFTITPTACAMAYPAQWARFKNCRMEATNGRNT